MLGWGSIYNTPRASLPQGEVLTAALVKIQAFWDVKPCGLENSRRGLGTAYYPHNVPNRLNVLGTAHTEDAGNTPPPRPSLLYQSPYGVTSRMT